MSSKGGNSVIFGVGFPDFIGEEFQTYIDTQSGRIYQFVGGQWVLEINFTVPNAPSVPTGLTVTPEADPNLLDISWTDSGADDYDLLVYTSVDGGDPVLVESVLLGVTGSPANAVNSVRILPGIDYTFRISAITAGVASVLSDPSSPVTIGSSLPVQYTLVKTGAGGNPAHGKWYASLTPGGTPITDLSTITEPCYISISNYSPGGLYYAATWAALTVFEAIGISTGPYLKGNVTVHQTSQTYTIFNFTVTTSSGTDFPTTPSDSAIFDGANGDFFDTIFYTFAGTSSPTPPLPGTFYLKTGADQVNVDGVVNGSSLVISLTDSFGIDRSAAFVGIPGSDILTLQCAQAGSSLSDATIASYLDNGDGSATLVYGAGVSFLNGPGLFVTVPHNIWVTIAGEA
jgi:hypothetical protein